MLTNKHKAQLIILTTFLFGVIIGASGQYLASRMLLIRSLPNNTDSPGPLGAGERGATTASGATATNGATATPVDTNEEMMKTVGVDSNQRVKIEEVLKESRQQYQDLKTQLKPQFTTLRDNCRARISALLRPEQQLRYDQWNKDLDLRREQKAKEDAAKEAAKQR